MRRYLFVCHGNFERSPYAEDFFRRLLDRHNEEGFVYSAGTDPELKENEGEWPDDERTYFSTKIALSSDVIFFMDDFVYREAITAVPRILEKRFRRSHTLPWISYSKRLLVNLRIPDCYHRNGDFKELAFLSYLDRVIDENGGEQSEEAQRIAQEIADRPEFRNQLNLEDLLSSRNFEQFIGDPPGLLG